MTILYYVVRIVKRRLWCNGNISAFQADASGSIPDGRNRIFILIEKYKNKNENLYLYFFIKDLLSNHN